MLDEGKNEQFFGQHVCQVPTHTLLVIIDMF